MVAGSVVRRLVGLLFGQVVGCLFGWSVVRSAVGWLVGGWIKKVHLGWVSDTGSSRNARWRVGLLAGARRRSQPSKHRPKVPLRPHQRTTLCASAQPHQAQWLAPLPSPTRSATAWAPGITAQLQRHNARHHCRPCHCLLGCYRICCLQGANILFQLVHEPCSGVMAGSAL